MKKKYEYKVIDKPYISPEKLNQLGSWGWSLQAVTYFPESYFKTRFYFMREKKK
jgi:hypothetical protein